MIKNNYSPHIFALCTLFVIGNTIVFLPFYSVGAVFVLISAVFSLLLLFSFCYLIKLGQKNRIVSYIAVFAVGLAAIYGAATAFFDFFKFLSVALLPKTKPFLLGVALLIVVFLFSLNKVHAIYKYSLLVAIICGAIIAVCFVGGIKNFDFSAFKSALNPTFEIKGFLKLFLPIIVLPYFIDNKNHNMKPVLFGVITGFLLLILCFLQSYFTLGASVNVTFPYLKAVSVISSGSLFTRLDGLVYFLFFVTTIIRITVCIKVVTKIVFQKGKKVQ